VPMPKPAATPAPPPPVAAIPAAPDVKPPVNAIPVPVTPPSMAAAPPSATAKAPETKPAEPPKVAAAPPEAKPVEAPKVAAPKPAPASEPKQLASIQPAAGAAAAGAFRVQIASLRTTEDAAKSWEKLKTTNPDLLGKLPGNVVRADLGDKGTFYRVVAGSFSDRDAANDFCAKLKQRNVGCLVVKP
jgi:hypothetical protein